MFIPKPIERLRSSTPDSSSAAHFVVLDAQSPPSIATGVTLAAIPFGGPSDLELPAFTAEIDDTRSDVTSAGHFGVHDHLAAINGDGHGVWAADRERGREGKRERDRG
ncbi:hypothetical protein M0R45_022410 [Rubus argutus]|uniref:Uncharacterized protein n=1 Tax=Rubus argutus TaxID=59490 RepID=A0AAW1XFI5_RUBAR